METYERWVGTVCLSVEPTPAQMDDWEDRLAAFAGWITHQPTSGIDVNLYMPGHLDQSAAMSKAIEAVAKLGHMESPCLLQVARESEWQRRKDTATAPKVMCATEIAELLGVRRQRIAQLSQTAAFPDPVIKLRSGPLWETAAVHRFAREWERKPGRPRMKSAQVEHG